MVRVTEMRTGAKWHTLPGGSLSTDHVKGVKQRQTGTKEALAPPCAKSNLISVLFHPSAVALSTFRRSPKGGFSAFGVTECQFKDDKR